MAIGRSRSLAADRAVRLLVVDRYALLGACCFPELLLNVAADLIAEQLGELLVTRIAERQRWM
jgi:hypothetical protein